MLSAAKVQIIYGIIAIKKKNVFRLFGSFEEYNYLCRQINMLNLIQMHMKQKKANLED